MYQVSDMAKSSAYTIQQRSISCQEYTGSESGHCEIIDFDYTSTKVNRLGCKPPRRLSAILIELV